MDQEKSSRFKFNADDGGTGSIFQEEINDIRLEKLSKKVTFISILVPCLIAVVIFFTYYDLKNKVIVNQDTGQQNIQNLSMDVETRLHELKTKYSDLENKLASRNAELEKKLSKLKFKLNKTNYSLKKMDESKANKKAIETPLKDMENMSAQLKALDNIIAKKISDLTETVDQAKSELTKMQADITILIAGKLDRKSFNDKLEQEQKLSQAKLESLANNLEKKIKSLQAQLNEIKKTNSKSQARVKTKPKPKKKTPSAPSTIGANTPPKTQNPDTESPETDNITEQDI